MAFPPVGLVEKGVLQPHGPHNASEPLDIISTLVLVACYGLSNNAEITLPFFLRRVAVGRRRVHSR